MRGPLMSAYIPLAILPRQQHTANPFRSAHQSMPSEGILASQNQRCSAIQWMATFTSARSRAVRPALVTLRLYHKIRKLVPTIKEHLMRHLSRNPNHIPGCQLLSHATLNRAVALFMGRNGFAIDISPADQQRRSAGLNKENITLRLMPFDLSVGFSVDREDRFIREIGELFHRRMVGIPRRLAGEFLDHGFQ